MNSIFEWISMRRDYVQKRISSDYNKCFSIYVQSKKNHISGAFPEPK